MPVFYGNDTTFKLITLNNSVILCDTANISQSFNSTPKKLTTGFTNTTIRDIGLFSNVIDISGPSLLTENSFIEENNISYADKRIIDTPSLIVALLSGYDYGTGINNYGIENVSIDQFDKFPIINKASLAMDNTNGLTGSIQIKGNVNQSPIAAILDYTSNIEGENLAFKSPLRTSNFYDFYVQYKRLDPPDPEPIYAGFNNINMSFDFNWKTIEYIGQNQYENYIFNGGIVKYDFEMLYKFPNYTSFQLFYQILSDGTTGLKTVFNELGGTTFSTSLDQSSFRWRLSQLMNNYSSSSQIYNMGYQALSTSSTGGKDGAIIENEISIKHKFPISTIKVSGERVLS